MKSDVGILVEKNTYGSLANVGNFLSFSCKDIDDLSTTVSYHASPPFATIALMTSKRPMRYRLVNPAPMFHNWAAWLQRWQDSS